MYEDIIGKIRWTYNLHIPTLLKVRVLKMTQADGIWYEAHCLVIENDYSREIIVPEENVYKTKRAAAKHFEKKLKFKISDLESKINECKKALLDAS